jgi:hypothetical protein
LLKQFKSYHGSIFLPAAQCTKSEIRLLIVKPGIASSAVKTELVHESLDSAPFYEALSYTWGDPSITKTIHLSTQQPSVQHVLRDPVQIYPQASSFPFDVPPISSLLSDLSVWRICHECFGSTQSVSTKLIPLKKGHGVELMGWIYQDSSRVYAWLGMLQMRVTRRCS